MITKIDAKTTNSMIKDRNLTSHIYIEEVAEMLAKKIPDYYNLMHTIIQRLHP